MGIHTGYYSVYEWLYQNNILCTPRIKDFSRSSYQLSQKRPYKFRLAPYNLGKQQIQQTIKDHFCLCGFQVAKNPVLLFDAYFVYTTIIQFSHKCINNSAMLKIHNPIFSQDVRLLRCTVVLVAAFRAVPQDDYYNHQRS